MVVLSVIFFLTGFALGGPFVHVTANNIAPLFMPTSSHNGLGFICRNKDFSGFVMVGVAGRSLLSGRIF